jgi:Short-chain dehydrogenases of various substrate specificities
VRAAKGAIVTIASTRALMSEPNTESYSASKGGLLALTHALAISLGPDVRVNCVSPGWIVTNPTRNCGARTTCSIPSGGSAGRKTLPRWSHSCSTANARGSSPVRISSWTAG